MRRIVLLAFACVMAVLATAGAAPARADVIAKPDPGRIDWRLSLFPPLTLDDPARGRGLFEMIVDGLQHRLPDLRHTLTIVSPAAMISAMEKGEPHCTVGRIRTAEREKYYVFSQIVYPALPNRLFISADAAARFGLGKGEADLERLLAQGLRLVVQDKRSYDALDRVLASEHGRSARRVWVTRDAVQFILSGNADAMIALPPEVQLLKAEFPDLHASFSSYPLRGVPVIALPLAVCTKGEWGAQMIARIDRAVDAAFIGELLTTYEDLLDARASLDLRAAFRDFGLLDGDRPVAQKLQPAHKGLAPGVGR